MEVHTPVRICQTRIKDTEYSASIMTFETSLTRNMPSPHRHLVQRNEELGWMKQVKQRHPSTLIEVILLCSNLGSKHDLQMDRLVERMKDQNKG